MKKRKSDEPRILTASYRARPRLAPADASGVSVVRRLHAVILKRNGKDLQAGDLIVGRTYYVNPGKDNKSGFKGVTWHKRQHKWRATIRLDGKYCSLGYFHNPEDAHAAYVKAASAAHGEFARGA